MTVFNLFVYTQSLCIAFLFLAAHTTIACFATSMCSLHHYVQQAPCSTSLKYIKTLPIYCTYLTHWKSAVLR